MRRGSTLSITHIFVIIGDLGLRLFGLLFSCATAVSAIGSWSFVSVQPNAVTIETGLLLGLKARVNAAQGASPGLDCPQKKLLGSMRDFIP